MEKNLAESVAKTVAAKEGKIKAACIEVANIVNDWRTEIVGGLDADGASEVIESHVMKVMHVIQVMQVIQGCHHTLAGQRRLRGWG